MKLVVIGLALSSSWGNGHATTYRALLKAFAARGHDVLFLEREAPWYAAHRDLAHPDFCRLAFYDSLEELDALARRNRARRRGDRRLLHAAGRRGRTMGGAVGQRRRRLLRYRHAGYARQAGARGS